MPSQEKEDSLINTSVKVKTDQALEENLWRLRKISASLRQLALMVLMFTLVGLMCLLILITAQVISLNVVFTLHRSVALISVATLVINIGAIVLYDGRRRVGDTLFEEISEELQWSITRNTESKVMVIQGHNNMVAEVKNYLPPLDIRIALREYVRTTGLPLLPGPSGPAIFAAICLIITFATLSLASFQHRSF